MTKYTLKLISLNNAESAESSISKTLKFHKTISTATIIGIFAGDIAHKIGVFKSKNSANLVSNKINSRGAFGGFGKYLITAVVCEVQLAK